MLSDIHCPLHLSPVSYTTSEPQENTSETVNVKNRIFRPKWKPALATLFKKTLDKGNIEDMMSDINTILVEFPDNANIDNINQPQYKINELVSKVGNLL